MERTKKGPVLDRARLAAALLVVAIYTGPLASYSAEGDFWLCRVLARLAVPFFFMLTGHFLARRAWRGTGALWRRTALLYGAAVLLYLPLNLYAGGFSPWQAVQKLLLTGTFYHLWYLPALLLGLPIAHALAKRGLRLALPAAAVLYLVGLAGDSWYGLACGLPGAQTVLDGLLAALGGYTRGGLFFAPLFLLLGAAVKPVRPRAALPGFLAALAALSAEAFWLKSIASPRHDSMYLTLPLAAAALFSGLLAVNGGRDRRSAKLAEAVYLVHPWCIVLVRGAAKALGLQAVLVENSLGHFAAAAALSAAVSALALAVWPVKPDPTARAWRQVDRTALAHNAKLLRRQAGCPLMAVIKADGYGHGAVKTARTLRRQGVRSFAVATLPEAIALRRAGILGEILVLGYTAPGEAALLARWRVSQALVSEEYAQALNGQGRKVRAHLALDTGMHRLGINAADQEALRRVFALPNLKIQGVFSHLCVADGLSAEAVAYTQGQAQRFFEAVEGLRAAGIDPGRTHLQASYGLLNLPPLGCGLARPGLALYGVYEDAAPVQRRLELWPALSLKARVAAVRRLKTGEGAGYGLAFTAARPTLLAVVSIGYADGLPRGLAAHGGEVLVRGKRAPVVGRLCMDQMLVDVTDVGQVSMGDAVTVIGRDGPEEIRAEELAARCGTITNELLAGLSPRLGLVYEGA